MRINTDTVETLIDRYGYYAYLIRLNKSVICECTHPVTKDPDVHCKKCLGTGYQFQISKVFLASRELYERESDKIQNFGVTPKIMYMKGFVDIHKDDLIVDSENVYTIYTFQHHRGVKGHQAYTRIVCPDLKLNKMTFLKMFKELMNEFLPDFKL